jgi:hypothetical protein
MNSVAAQKAIKGDKYRVSMAATFEGRYALFNDIRRWVGWEGSRVL